MKKLYLSLILGILLISIVSSLNITPGDSYSFTLEEQFEYYTIVGNSTDVNLSIIQNGTNVTIYFDKYMNDDAFSIFFFDEKEEIGSIHKSNGGSGGVRKFEESKPCKNCSNLDDLNNTIPIEITDEGDKKIPLELVLIVLVMLGILACTLILYIYVITKRKNGVHKNN